MVEEALPSRAARAARAGAPGGEKPRPLAAVTAGAALRRSTGLAELDRVLGGGLVAGSVVLVGGDPGIGKSNARPPGLRRARAPGACPSSTSRARSRRSRCGCAPTASAWPRRACWSSPRRRRKSVAELIGETHPAAVVVDSIQTLHTARSAPRPQRGTGARVGGAAGRARESERRRLLSHRPT